jgi:type II secretory pathway component PulK
LKRSFSHPTHLPAGKDHGSILLAVLCLVATLSFIIVTGLAVAVRDGEMQSQRHGMLRARQLAEMGVAVAANPAVKPGDPILQHQVSPIEAFRAVLSTEESRLNLNKLLTEERLPLLESIFNVWGMSPADAQAVAASLLDWRDPDDLKRRPDSAEKLDYEQEGFADRPFNRSFASLDDLDLVKNFERVYEVKPDWRDCFTLKGSGQLDINAASAEVIASLTGASPGNAEQLVETRNGPDGLPHTQDDTPLTSIEQALVILGLSAPQASQITPLLTLQGPTRRIESTGRAGNDFCGIAVLVSHDGGPARVSEWREFNVGKENRF